MNSKKITYKEHVAYCKRFGVRPWMPWTFWLRKIWRGII